MKVDPTRRAGVSNVKRSGGGAKGVSGEFARLLKSTSETEATSGPVATSAVDSLLSIQEVSDQGGGNKKARQRAELMLDRLEDIRNGLLLGGIPRAQLEELARVARQTREGAIDPALAEVLDDIELRARVEIAKYDTA